MTVLMANFRESIRVTDQLMDAVINERESIERDGIVFKASFEMGGDLLSALAIDYPQPEVGLQLITSHENAIGRIVSRVNEPRPMLYVTSESGAASDFATVETLEQSVRASQREMAARTREDRREQGPRFTREVYVDTEGRMNTLELDDRDVSPTARSEALFEIRDKFEDMYSVGRYQQTTIVGQAEFAGRPGESNEYVSVSFDP